MIDWNAVRQRAAQGDKQAQAQILNAGTAATGIGPTGQVGQGIQGAAPGDAESFRAVLSEDAQRRYEADKARSGSLSPGLYQDGWGNLYYWDGQGKSMIGEIGQWNTDPATMALVQQLGGVQPSLQPDAFNELPTKNVNPMGSGFLQQVIQQRQPAPVPVPPAPVQAPGAGGAFQARAGTALTPEQQTVIAAANQAYAAGQPLPDQYKPAWTQLTQSGTVYAPVDNGGAAGIWQSANQAMTPPAQRAPGDLTGAPGAIAPPGTAHANAGAPGAPGTPANSTSYGGTTVNFQGPNPYGSTGLKPGDQTFFGAIVGDGENGLPGGLGQAWHELRLKTLLDLIGMDGQMRDPTTGQVIQGAQTLAAIKQADDIANRWAETMGVDAQGKATLEAQKFQNEREQQLYNRSANPALAFENEYARGNGGSYFDPTTQTVQGGVTTKTPPIAAVVQSPGEMVFHANEAAPQAPGVRVPAVLNALRSGTLVPSVGQINAPSTVQAPQQATWTERDFRLQNQKNEPKLSSVTKLIRSSYGRAGGVTDDQQNELLNLGAPKERSLTPSFSGR